MNCGRVWLSELFSLLQQGVEQLKVPCDASVLENMLLYIDYLHRWNQTYNLTAIRDKKEMVIKHILDSLALYPFIQGNHCLDVGTGPGLPGLILALALPHIEFTLLDSQIKKTQFINRVLRELPVANVRVCHERVENHRPEVLYDVIVSRAFSSLDDMIKGTTHLRAPEGHYLAMKGVYPQEEIAAIESYHFSIEVEALQVPFLTAERHVVIIR
jgi:16S rRNA (guanine527-N7)-methyltransferase